MDSCFVIQPFDEGVYDERFEAIFAPAIREAGLKPDRVDGDPSVSIVINRIQAGIRRARVCFAEISENNPNVWYEVGYAIACLKPLVFVADRNRRKKLPFDAQHRRVIMYDPMSLAAMTRGLRDQIVETLRATLATGPTNASAGPTEERIATEGSLAGIWIAQYVEDDLGKPPYVVRERVEMRQDHDQLHGTYYCETYEREPFELEARVNRGSVLGSYRVPFRKAPDSSGAFQLKLGRNDEWLEGYCTWLDHGSGRVECSKSVWFRPGGPYSAALEAEAARIMASELVHFSQRRGDGLA